LLLLLQPLLLLAHHASTAAVKLLLLLLLLLCGEGVCTARCVKPLLLLSGQQAPCLLAQLLLLPLLLSSPGHACRHSRTAEEARCCSSSTSITFGITAAAAAAGELTARHCNQASKPVTPASSHTAISSKTAAAYIAAASITIHTA
jgi:hypothetical protein